MKALQFQLSVAITDVKTQEPVAFKVDGQRFGTSTKTLKFFTGNTYQLQLTTKPNQDLYRLEIAGKDIEVHSKTGEKGVFVSTWTADIQPVKKGKREDIQFIILGSFGNLNIVWQCKFYPPSSSHGKWGEKLGALNYKCSGCEDGSVRITDEEFQ